jgi:hypothetical protein
MSYHWPAGVALDRVVLDVEDRICDECGGMMFICDHRYRRVFTFQGAWQLVCKLVHCVNPDCVGRHRTFSPESELGIAPPFWAVGWDVFCWVGHRRLSRHWSVPQIRGELADSHGIDLSADAIEKYIHRYQTMLAARHQDPQLLAEEYRNVKEVVLSIDGLQPEKGHETLYVVRELTLRRVWFAESLISSSGAEVQRLLELAGSWAQRLGKSVKAWVSDKQEAFVTGIAEVFPGVPHRYCRNHFLRDLAKPVLEIDSAAKVQMRSKVRGLRSIEKEILAQAEQDGEVGGQEREAPEPAGEASEAMPVGKAAASVSTQEQVALDYCTAVRGILNNDQGGPLQPPGLEMAQSLTQVRASIQQNLDAKKGGLRRST